MKIAVIIINIIFILLFLPSVGALMPTVMMFDAPGSTKSPYTILTAISLVSIPVFILISQIGSWWLFIKAKYQVALWWSLLPFVPILLAVLGFVLINVLQGGSFSAK